MAEIIDVQMPADQVVNAVKQMQSAIAGLESKVSGLGSRVNLHDPFLKGERAVSRATGSMVSNLVNATSVSDALATSLASVERGGRLGLGLAVGVAAGVAAFEALSKAIQHSHEVHDAAEKALNRPFNLQSGLDPAGIGSEINATAAALAAEQKQNASFSEALLNTYLPSRLANPFVGVGGKGGVETNFDRELALNEKLNALSQARGEAELRIAQFKKDALGADEHEVAYAKAQLDFKNKVSALKLDAANNPAGAAGFAESYKALQMELEVAKQIADKKQEKADSGDLIKQEEDRAASEIANFQGTKQEKEDFSTDRNKERLQNEIDILHAYGLEEQEKKKLLELDELSGKASEKKAEEDKKAADEKFKNDSEVKKATTDNQVTQLQQQGNSFAANILKIREQTESKIAQHLRDQKGELAQQDAISAQLALRQAAKDALRNPGGAQAQQRAAAQEDQAFDAKIAYYMDQVKRGVKFDESDPAIQIIKQYLQARSKLPTGAGGQDKAEDFSSVASLAGKDFSSLAELGKVDFTGLKALGGLTISIAQ